MEEELQQWCDGLNLAFQLSGQRHRARYESQLHYRRQFGEHVWIAAILIDGTFVHKTEWLVSDDFSVEEAKEMCLKKLRQNIFSMGVAGSYSALIEMREKEHANWRREPDMITIGFKKGEADFSINGLIATLSLNEMKELRAMIPVAIGTAEDMFRAAREKDHPASNAV